MAFSYLLATSRIPRSEAQDRAMSIVQHVSRCQGLKADHYINDQDCDVAERTSSGPKLSEGFVPRSIAHEQARDFGIEVSRRQHSLPLLPDQARRSSPI